ncbi:MAG: FHA domain-containing protein [Bacteroidaceae bacterium]|nr:FHA domain-containing protein [Bacteroidaceae bacterium]
MPNSPEIIYQDKKNVRCPSCDTRLTVSNSKNLPQILIECPKCHQRLSVKFHEAVEAKTEMVAKPKSTATVLPPTTRWPLTPGTLFCNGMASLLHEGKNSCGRLSPASNAQHQFPADKGVSKEHFDINVRKRTDESFLVTLTLHKQGVSPTFVDNLPVMYGDEIVLRDNSSIVAHNTRFTYSSKQQ